MHACTCNSELSSVLRRLPLAIQLVTAEVNRMSDFELDAQAPERRHLTAGYRIRHHTYRSPAIHLWTPS